MARVAAIYRPAVEGGTASFEITAPDEMQMLARYRATCASGFPYLVAELDGMVAGYGYLGAWRPRPAYRFTVENSLYVAPEAQRRGVGRALLEALIRRSEARGDRRMIAVIAEGAKSASIGLHRALGFEHAGTLPGIGYKHQRWLDVELMIRAIGRDVAEPREAPVIAVETPDQPEVHAFLAASDAYATQLYPPESNHLLDIGELLRPVVRFHVARRDGVAVGCGAYVEMGERCVEIKRMWVDPCARGLGVGERLLERLEIGARAGGAMVARLETGIHNREALRLYRRAGYAEIGPFGSYRPDPLSVFMEKAL